MPRTKRPVRKQEKSTEDDEALKKLRKICEEHKRLIDSKALMEIRNLEVAFTIFQGSICNEYLHMTIGQLKSELHLKEVTNTRQTRHSSRTTSHDDGYLTQNSSHGSGDGGARKKAIPRSVDRSAASHRSRSADASARKIPVSCAKTNQRRRSKSVYKTPACNKMGQSSYPVITPKIAPQTPLTILRQPRQGEVVLSLSGSPVMVPNYNNMQPDKKANCNILLKDGTMLSLQPEQLRQSQAFIPFALMDSNVMAHLKILKDNLETVVKLGEKQLNK